MTNRACPDAAGPRAPRAVSSMLPGHLDDHREAVAHWVHGTRRARRLVVRLEEADRALTRVDHSNV